MKHKKRNIGILIISSFVAVVLFVLYHSAARISESSMAIFHVENDPPAATVPLEKIVILRSNQEYGAIKIIRSSSHRGLFDGVRYEYWYFGEVLNNNPTIREHGYSYAHESNPESPFMGAKHLRIEWSLGNHLYANPGKDGVSPIEFAPTDWKDESEIDLQSESLRWVTKNEITAP